MAKKPAKSKKATEKETETTQPEVAETKVAVPETAIADPIGDETDGEAANSSELAAGPETPAEIEAAEDEALAEAEVEDGPDAETGDSEDDAEEEDSEYNDGDFDEDDDEEVEDEEEDEDSDEDDSEEEDEEEGLTEEADSEEEEADPEFSPKPRPPAKLERLQKILAQAGVASRRKAEEMIEQGRVQVNGKIVTELGTKADAGRDHIRVDGKLLQGAERLRYFVLNKPKGFVTTVKDPEGRPTVMQFFEKMRERLYPVGRLDYMSEGLLLVTNDGELANRLTRAAAGVEKTYLVKVAGQPTEDELDLLRGGVSIERGKPGTPRVRTSPARIRQVRQGDNPWYEVVLIEGRNRELRKMFEEIGHFVEKIRRVGYGPLVLDQEPGNLRELDASELELLRKAADGKLRTPKSKEIRRRNITDALPTVNPRSATSSRPVKPFRSAPATDYRSKRSFETGPSTRPARPAGGEGYRPAPGRPADNRTSARGPAGSPARPYNRPGSDRPGSDRPRTDRPVGRDFGSSRPTPGNFAPRAPWKKDGPPSRPPARFDAGTPGEERPSAPRPYSDRPSAGRTFGSKPAGRPYGDRPSGPARPFGARPSSDKPAWKKPGSDDRFGSKRPAAPRRDAPVYDDDLGPVKPPNLHIEEVPQSEQREQRSSRASASRPYSARPRTGGDRPSSGAGRPSYDRPNAGGSRSSYSRPSSGGDRTGSSSRPPRPEGGMARPFTTSSGMPRAGGARPSSKPGSSSNRPYGAGGGSGARSGSGSYGAGPRSGSSSRPPSGAGRSFDRPSTGYKRPAGGDSDGPKRSFPSREGTFSPRTPRPEGGSSARPSSGGSWKPKPSFGGPSRPSSGGRPKPGGFSKSGFKGKPSGGKRPGGAPGGKKRG